MILNDMQLGYKATFEGITKAGHLVHLERPCVYNRCLKHFLSSIHPDSKNK
ncbi:putative alpha/Beta hydrolase [Lupinus albus]|uniref:Putative alpha/Beta hydrolase n=1 Tax=Lupinus albus TaxID=3870 RepID=A0A6A4PYC7_LUPAL|nr:putative alpha/Beta hydrolase [Lupinus albus]